MVSGFSGDDLDYDTADLSSDSEKEDEQFQEPEFKIVKPQSNLACCIFGQTDMAAFEGDAVEPGQQKTSGLFGEKSFPQVCQETQKESNFGKVPNYGLISVIVKSPDNLT